MKNYYIIENNIKSIVNIFATKIRLIIKFKTIYKKYQFFAHVNDKIIKHFIKVIKEMKIININIVSDAVLKINECKIYTLTKV